MTPQNLEKPSLSLESLVAQGAVWQAAPVEPTPLWSHPPSPRTAIPFSAPEIDSALPHGGLSCGSIHEIYLNDPDSFITHARALPALLAYNTVRSHCRSRARLWERSNVESFPFLIVWIGRGCWPTPFSIAPHHLPSHLFIDPPTEKLTLWAIETALRSPVVKLVIADTPRISLVTTRRFALTAKHSHTTAILLRKPSDRSAPSAAATRWMLTPMHSHEEQPTWELSLKQVKGGSPHITSWHITMEGGYESGEDLSLRVLPRVVDSGHEEKVTLKKFGT